MTNHLPSLNLGPAAQVSGLPTTGSSGRGQTCSSADSPQACTPASTTP